MLGRVIGGLYVYETYALLNLPFPRRLLVALFRTLHFFDEHRRTDELLELVGPETRLAQGAEGPVAVCSNGVFVREHTARHDIRG